MRKHNLMAIQLLVASTWMIMFASTTSATWCWWTAELDCCDDVHNLTAQETIACVERDAQGFPIPGGATWDCEPRFLSNPVANRPYLREDWGRNDKPAVINYDSCQWESPICGATPGTCGFSSQSPLSCEISNTPSGSDCP